MSGFWAQPESSNRVAKTAVEAKRNGRRDIEKQLKKRRLNPTMLAAHEKG